MKKSAFIFLFFICCFNINSQKRLYNYDKGVGFHTNFNFQKSLGLDFGINYIFSKNKNWGNSSMSSDFITSSILLSGNIYFVDEEIFLGGTLGYEFGHSIGSGNRMYSYNLGIDLLSIYKNDFRVGASVGISYLQLIFLKYTLYLPLSPNSSEINNNKVSLGLRFNASSFVSFVNF